MQAKKKKQQAQVAASWVIFFWVILHFHKAYEFIIKSGMQMIVGAYEYYKPNARGLKISYKKKKKIPYLRLNSKP